MKRIIPGALGLLIAPALIAATFSTAGFKAKAFEESGNYTENELNENTDEENSSDITSISISESYDVCFYIRGNSIGSEIPSEPLPHFGETYSDAIRINGAVSSDNLVLSQHEVDGSEDSLMSDNFTACNSVSEMLTAIPDAEAIRNIIPEFDENKHYVVWYVMKTAVSNYPNLDVYLHVDGVIREKTSPTPDSENENGNTDIPEDEPGENPADTPGESPADYPSDTPSDKPGDAPADNPGGTPADKPGDAPADSPSEPPSEIFTPEEIAELEKLGSEVEIEIEALYLDENGNEAKKIPYDGKEHLIGGFSINVKDKADHSLIEQLRYNYRGELITYAADDCTLFNVRDRVFSINITGAYVKAKEVGEAVVSFYCGSNKLSGPEDFVISDEKGRPITSYLNVVSKAANISVTARELTIEAGTTVINDNGKTLTNDNYEITGGSLLDGHKIDHVVFNGSQTGAGESPNQITSVTIVDDAGKDVTYLYNIRTVDGKLILVDASPDNTVTQDENTSKTIQAVSSDAASETLKVIAEKSDTALLKVSGKQEDTAGTVLGARKAATEDKNSSGYHYLMLLSFAAVLLYELHGIRHRANTDYHNFIKGLF